MGGPGGGHSAQAAAAIATATTLLVLVTVAGNALVVVAVLRSPALRAPQNLFLVSLAAADILVAALIIPFSLANELLGYWYFEKTWCEIYLALDVLFCTSSIVHLCAISLDRYWSVSAVGYNAKRTPRRVKRGIGTVWAIAAAISLPPLVYKGREKKEEEVVLVGTRLQCKLNEEAWYVLSSSIGSFFAPCLIMVLVYLRIYFIAKRRHRSRPAGTKPPGDRSPNITKPPGDRSPNITKPPGDTSPNITSREPPRTCLPVDRTSLLSPEDPPGSPNPMVGTCPQAGGHPRDNRNHSRDTEGRPRDTLATKLGQVMLARGPPVLNPWRRKTQVKREQRFTLVLAVVIGVFILCWFPFFFLYSLGALCPRHCKVPEGVFQVFFWIGYCNSSLNPIIYTIFNRDFRRAFRHLLCPRAPAPC